MQFVRAVSETLYPKDDQINYFQKKQDNVRSDVLRLKSLSKEK